MLSIVLPYEVESDRIKSVAHPSPRVWLHHIELHDVNEIRRGPRLADGSTPTRELSSCERNPRSFARSLRQIPGRSPPPDTTPDIDTTGGI